jgi:hypothetical protein
MTVSPDLEHRVAAWLEARASAEGSDVVLARALERASHVRQDRTRALGPMMSVRRLGRSMVVAAAIAVAMVVVAVTAIPPIPNAAIAKVTGVWPTGADVAFTAVVPADAPDGIGWRVASYDDWSGSARTWGSGAVTQTSVDAGASILGATGEAIAPEDRTQISVTIWPSQELQSIVAPGIPVALDAPTRVATAGPGGPLLWVSLARPSASYQVTAIPVPSSDTSTLLASRLRAAGMDYPDDIRARYAKPPDAGELGAASNDFLAAIRASAGDDPFQIATAMVEAFQIPTFTYATDTRNVDCGRDGFTECFLRVRRGYCVYFSTAMVMLLRQQGIPARFVTGYLPGERNGTEVTVRTHDAHAWVEVFFPESGWIAFDPTPRPPEPVRQPVP